MKAPSMSLAKARRMTPKQRAAMHEQMHVAIDAMALILGGLQIYTHVAKLTPEQRAAAMDRMRAMGEAAREPTSAKPAKARGRARASP